MPSTKVEDVGDKGDNSVPQKDKSTTKMDMWKKLQHNSCFQTFVFLVVVALDGADLIADWLLFRDVYMIKEGLVYGPPEDSITFALLAFSIIGTLTFVFEIINIWWEIFRENPWINPDLASAITIWIEDIPQLVISILIAVCREEAISYFQLVKASVLISGIVIRIIICLIRYCNKKNLAEMHEHNKTSCLHVTYRFIIMIGLILVFAGSIAVFILTQFERSEDGSIKYNLPKTIFKGKYDEERYFQNVSIYFHHPAIDFHDANNADVNWIRIISIFDIREKGSEIFKLDFDTSTKSKLILWHTNSNGSLAIANCYTLDKTSRTVSRGSTCLNHLAGTATTSFIFKFEFIPKKIPNLLFGDIKFNCIVKENGVCHNPTDTILMKLSDIPTSSPKSDSVIHYYRTKDVSQEHHLLWTAGTNTARFYRNMEDLIDITEVWKTGFGYCDSTGSLAPHMDTTISINCNV